ncbi:MAG: hypothetical protein WHT09_14905 [Thermogutta sp.]
MNSQPQRVHCVVANTQCVWNTGLGRISFTADQPEQGFLVVFQKPGGEGSGEQIGRSVICRILRKSQGRLEPGFVLEEFFLTTDGRCLVRFRHATKEFFHLSLVVTVSRETTSASDSSCDRGDVPPTSQIAVLEAVLLMRTEVGETQPDVVLLDEIDALSTEILGQIRVCSEDLKNSAIPFVPSRIAFVGNQHELAFDVAAWRLPGSAWLLGWVHPLDGSPVHPRELSEWQIIPPVQTVAGNMPVIRGYEILPGGIEKGVTFAARCIYMLGEGAIPQEAVMGRLRQFLVSQPPLSEG